MLLIAIAMTIVGSEYSPSFCNDHRTSSSLLEKAWFSNALIKTHIVVEDKTFNF